METTSPIKIIYVASALNEESNLWKLYKRSIKAFESAKIKIKEKEITFNMLLIDNNSKDQTIFKIKEIMNHDNRVKGINNLQTYTSEISMAYGLKKAIDMNPSIIIMMCSDLQDPPELTEDMITSLILNEDSYDSIFAFKKGSNSNRIMSIFRKLYYKILRFSDRDSKLINGFHGFSCMKLEAAKRTFSLLENTNLNMRNSMTMASYSSLSMPFTQPPRESGKSSYSILGYINEAKDAIFKSKSFTPRLSLRIGVFLFLISLIISIFLLANTIFYGGGYAGGIPTITLIITFGFSTQILLLGMISRQIENITTSGSKKYKIASRDINIKR